MSSARSTRSIPSSTRACSRTTSDGTAAAIRADCKGTEIPLQARIVAFADTFDVITHGRRYERERSVNAAREVIAAGRGTQFDPELTDLFLSEPVFAEIVSTFHAANAPQIVRPDRRRCVRGRRRAGHHLPMAERSDRAAASGSLALKSARITATPRAPAAITAAAFAASMPPIADRGPRAQRDESLELREPDRIARVALRRRRVYGADPDVVRIARLQRLGVIPHRHAHDAIRAEHAPHRSGGKIVGADVHARGARSDREIRAIVHDERHVRRQRRDERARYFHLRTRIRIFEPQLHHRRAATHARERALHDLIAAAGHGIRDGDERQRFRIQHTGAP